VLGHVRELVQVKVAAGDELGGDDNVAAIEGGEGGKGWVAPWDTPGRPSARVALRCGR
jgi:hypothetical protein